jgi:capsule biosynthesis phosphatase
VNIIIPAAGVGSRFTRAGYTVPKPLIPVLGDPMIAHVIRGLKLCSWDRVYIVYTQDLEQYSFSNILKNQFREIGLVFVPLEYNTRGPAETVLCGLNRIPDLDAAVMVMDCDTIYGGDFLAQAREQDGNFIFYFEDESEETIYSYIKLDEDGVREIAEKKRISNHACSGAYGFRDGHTLKKYCEIALNQGHKTNNEYYVSGLYAAMLADGEKVIPCQVKDFHCLGTPRQLQAYCMGHAAEAKRFCFDLDGTLVTFPDIKGDYSTVRPIMKNIRMVRYLYEAGHTIIIQTARNMLSSGHNPGRAAARAHAELFETLDRFDIPYHEIYFGKPYAHYYIDDLSARPFAGLEREIGFYDDRIGSRPFNRVEISDGRVTKTTNNPGELYWYRHIPNNKKTLFPAVHSIRENVIEMERIDGIVFTHLAINGSLTLDNISNLVETIHGLHVCRDVPESGLDYSENYTAKMVQRYLNFDYESVSRDWHLLMEKITAGLVSHSPRPGVIHGDPVFSNIFLCDNRRIRFIDMRGRVGETDTIFGDVFYDYAKIYQSLYGYDFILTDRPVSHGYLADLRGYFEALFITRFGMADLTALKYITASLLFSLIPLHEDPGKRAGYYHLAWEIVDEI